MKDYFKIIYFWACSKSKYMYKSIRSILNNSSVQGERSNVLKGLIWPPSILAIVGFLMLVSSSIMPSNFKAAVIVIGILFVVVGVPTGVVVYYLFYWRSYNTDPNLLRSEKFVEKMAAIEKLAILGDSSNEQISEIMTTNYIQVESKQGQLSEKLEDKE